MVTEISRVGDEIWLASATGAFRVDQKSNQAVSLKGNPYGVLSIVPVGDEIWLAAVPGAFRVDRKNNQAVPLKGNTGSVFKIVPVGDEIWLDTYEGAFRVDRKKNHAVPVGGGRGSTGSVYSIMPIGDEIWLGTEKGAFRSDWMGNTVVRVGGVTGPVEHIVVVGDEIWLGAWEGVFRVDRKNNQAVPLKGDTSRVFSIVPVGDEIWLGSANGVFRVDRAGNQAVPLGGGPVLVEGIVPVGDEVWLWAQKSAFLVDRHTRIRIDVEGALPGVSRLLRVPVWIEGVTRPVVRYVDARTGKQNYDSNQAAPIRLAYDSDLAKLREKEKHEDWTKVTQDGPPIELKPGWRKIYFAVQDRWQNKPEAQAVEGWVIPTWTLSVLIPIVSITLCLTCLALAPYVRYCHMLLMNPFLRNWASFGIVPLLLTAVPPLRRHILQRYCRTLACAPRLQFFRGRYVIPDERFTLSAFAARLSGHKVIGLHGQSGIGKSAFLTYLAQQCASREAAHPLLRRLVPLFVDLSVAGGLDPEVLVRTELRKHGDLTDKKLTEVLLDQGEFLFLFDGLNEVSEPSGLAILQFADMHRNHSYSCLTTQVATDALKKVSTLVASSPLSDEKVKELVRKLAMDPKTKQEKFNAESLLNKFSDEIYKICCVPVQLELIVEMWEASGTLPRNLDGLYSYVLGPLLDREAWSSQGHGDWPDVLSGLAFTMMAEKRPYDQKKDYLPDELRTQLVGKKLFVERGEVIEFRRDRIRAYLAAKHFSLRWRTILMDEKTRVDANWDAMLEFHLAAEQEVHRTEDLLFLVVKKDMDAAIRLNSWGLQNRPELFGGWQDSFTREIGKRVLGGSEKIVVSG